MQRHNLIESVSEAFTCMWYHIYLHNMLYVWNDTGISLLVFLVWLMDDILTLTGNTHGFSVSLYIPLSAMLIPYKMVSYHSLQCEAMIHLKWGALQEWLRLDDQRYCLLDLNRHIHELLEAAKHDDKVHVQSIGELCSKNYFSFILYGLSLTTTWGPQPCIGQCLSTWY